MTSLKQSGTGLVLQLQKCLDARFANCHFHGQIEEPGVSVSHLASSQDLANYLPAGRLPLDTQRLVFDVDPKTGREDLDSSLWIKGFKMLSYGLSLSIVYC